MLRQQITKSTPKAANNQILSCNCFSHDFMHPLFFCKLLLHREILLHTQKTYCQRNIKDMLLLVKRNTV